ncbi:MAG: asparagine synthase (glutamine-hydrolyzing) [Deltaproteobacteria bacterium]|nr:asparagine synthase (glutamine-hydrolyzing) [Deltaproteobacteria bacterium]
MCGIVAAIDRTAGEAARCAEIMANAIRHRGPDDYGVWTDSDVPLAIGHRRLSIVDVSVEGHQPMVSSSGRFVISFNGEIYNHSLIRKELTSLGHSFRGYSDTEVVLASFDEWGVVAAIERFVGMFAIILWDIKKRTLTLIRDRLGIKPLFYGGGSQFMAASELKALKARPGSSLNVDRSALALYLRYGYVPAPYSIYEGIFKLEPGCILELSETDLKLDRLKDGLESIRDKYIRYWSAEAVARHGIENPFQGSQVEVEEWLEELLTDSVKLRMIADVPLGAFLSGGIDSSLIVALMKKNSSSPIKTFCIGFHEKQYDEGEYARRVADYLGTDHTEMYLDAQDSLDVIPLLPSMFDEPLGDPSQIPTYLVSKMARASVTVALSGDGGDELFGGYERYAWTVRLWNLLSFCPAQLKKLFAFSVNSTPARLWEILFSLAGLVSKEIGAIKMPSEKLLKAAELFGERTPEKIYTGLTTHWKDSEIIVNSSQPVTFSFPSCTPPGDMDLWEKMTFIDLVTYLPGDILTKLDRASMAASLEARVPLLDHRVVEFCLSIPNSMRFAINDPKHLLKRILYRHLPRSLVDRPKQGFNVPIGDWLRGPLRGWAEDLLSENRLRQEGYFEPREIRNKWEQHLSGRRNYQVELWTILQFQSWKSDAV